MSIISEWATRALAISVVLTLTACGAQPSGIDNPTATHSMAGMDHGTMPMNNVDVPYDAQFIDSMIVHHQGAIEMANQVQQEAQKPELQTLAQNIITAQQAEIAQLQQWRKE
jgi:uncharacterized protein (DUF305 family)